MHIFFSISLLFICSFINNIYSQDFESSLSSNYYLIRHAEKNRTIDSDRNPHLSDFGILRSKNWARVLENVKFDKIYSTNFFRTIETAKPLVDANNLEIIFYTHNEIDYNKFLEDNSGKNILIVGHSNTIPFIVNSLIGLNKYDLIDDHNNSNLYIVTIGSNGNISDKLLNIAIDSY